MLALESKLGGLYPASLAGLQLPALSTGADLERVPKINSALPRLVA